MKIFLCKEFLNNISINKDSINAIVGDLLSSDSSNNKYFMHQAYFLLGFAFFETSCLEAIRHLYSSFPEKIGKKTEIRLTSDYLTDVLFDSFIMFDKLVEDVVRDISRDNIRDIFSHLVEVSGVKKSDFANYESSIELLYEISKLRNMIVHENSISTSLYKSSALNNDRNNNALMLNYMKSLVLILEELVNLLQKKFYKSNYLTLLKSLWKETFKTPLLPFDSCWTITNVKGNELMINSDHMKGVANRLSSGEKFYLSFIIQQYSGSINDELFKFENIPALVSISDITIYQKILLILRKYPNFFTLTLDSIDTEDYFEGEKL